MQLQNDNTTVASEVEVLQSQLTGLREEFREFVYRVSHDVNTPMYSVMHFLQLLRDKYQDVLLDSQGYDYLTYINKDVSQMQARLAGLLEYSRVDTLMNPAVDVDCALVLERCLKLLRPAISQCNAVIRTDILPTVLGEPRQLEKLFAALIHNAITYCSPERTLEIHVTVRAMPNANAWMFCIEDNGMGIPAAYHQEIFQIFRHGSNDNDRKGIGIGLALVRKILRHHRGDIWVASVPGKGSSFFFTLPSDDRLLKEGMW